METNHDTPAADRLLLLFGMPRSGTTWLGKIFDSHPDVLYTHEPDNEFKIDQLPLIYTGESTPELTSYLADYASRLSQYNTLRTRGKQPTFPKSFLSSTGLARLKVSINRGRVFERLGLPYSIWNPVARNHDAARFQAWKSVLSVGMVGTLLDATPGSRMVYILRHPGGQIASILSGEEGDKFVGKTRGSDTWHVFSMLLETDFGRRSGMTLEKLKSLEPIERLAWKWTLFNQKAVDEITARPGRGLLVRYDDLCAQPVATSESLFTFCGLDFHEQSRQFVDQSTNEAGQSNSYYSVFKDPHVSANKWRERLSPQQKSQIRNIVVTSDAGTLFADDF